MGSCLSGDRNNHAIPYSEIASTSRGDGVVTRSNSNRKITKKSSSPSIDSPREMSLHRVPGRMFLNGSTDHASLFTRQGKKGINQDAMIVWENFGSKADTIFCGVFDGHGPFGHMVAKKVRDSLPLKLSAQWELGCQVSPPVLVNKDSGTSHCDPGRLGSSNDIHVMLKESFLKAFKVMDKELKLHPYIDCYTSGTTSVALIKQGRDLIIGNVGDSRAVLGTRDQSNSLIAVQLTVDLKPNLPREAERIRLCKGRIFALQNEPETFRVWLPDSDSPGLAMARAFGDFCLKDFGLIAVPDVSCHHLNEKDEFVVLATDGVWDVLSNEEVVAIVASSPRSSAARIVVDTASRAWRSKYPTAKVDDCAVVCLYLDSSESATVTTQEQQELTKDMET
ncbi:probable protein phosphatase 2C 33 isoform X1 [Cucurbita maxima]|uniref:Probable protein phosphatase 2C 33 isoform X1 n=1 Tax=Cucurbita maxima TaxID=3661 RepID=A0A6J1JV96_CUCMA|nr:probable protein phosphatase 2C 33 isoform X1 [Cucurbita maxima]XP_022992279.1 probable protein phosphatase 2C 33 isoform X1 [Cucurbita maxima]XP_022992280.1 probable protein phosphatase 2C 33 isoform X1 [Cucurbita maxima]